MGQSLACCCSKTHLNGSGTGKLSATSSKREDQYVPTVDGSCQNSVHHPTDSSANLQHISEREPDDAEDDPSQHPTARPVFMERSKSELNVHKERKRHHRRRTELDFRLHKRYSSCSTIFLDECTVSQPNLKATLKCVSLAIYMHIKHRQSNNRLLDIFDERIHPLTKDAVPDDYIRREPDQRQIYKFVRTLFNAAQLTVECAIITLVYLERLLTFAEIDIAPSNWKRSVLGAILLSSKVWEDQAVWNVDYCQILKEVTVEDMNELERHYLELIQYNINVPSSVYAKYYFDLRSLAEANDLLHPSEPLTKERAAKLEAMSSVSGGGSGGDACPSGGTSPMPPHLVGGHPAADGAGGEDASASARPSNGAPGGGAASLLAHVRKWSSMESVSPRLNRAIIP